MSYLSFSKGTGNAKLKQINGKLYTFSLPSGWSCPGAKDCYHKAVVSAVDGSVFLKEGPNTEFRCFSASQEVAFPAVRIQRQRNYDAIKEALKNKKAVELLLNSIPKDASIIRIHVGGDFFSDAYFKAWLKVAEERPNIIFYAYTKSINIWVNHLDEIPANFKLNASRGSKYDDLIDKHKLKSAEVVYSVQEAEDKGLEIDHDDTHAFLKDDSFALLIHGVQAKGSKASAAVKALKGIGSYGKSSKK